MTEEQALTLAREDGPAYLAGTFELVLGSLAPPGSPKLFGQGTEWDGLNMKKVCFAVVRSVFAATRPI